MSNVTPDLRQQGAFEFGDEAALLIRCLRGLPLFVPPNTDWLALLGMAEENGVLALVHQSLLEMGTEMPEFFMATARKSRSSAERLATELEALLQSFAEGASMFFH